MDERRSDQTVPLDSLQAVAHQPRVSLLIHHDGGIEAVAIGPTQSVVVGRSHPSDVPIPDPSLSRQHARFTWREEGVEVRDLGSTNGTTVGGRRVDTAIVRPGDEVVLGQVIVSLHERTSPIVGVESADRLRLRLEEEVSRARYFGQSLTLLLLRSSEPEALPTHQWCPVLQKLVRPVDRIVLRDAQAVAVIMPQAGHEDAMRLALDVIRGGDQRFAALRCGVALFPETAGTAAKLVEVASLAASRADRDHPVCSASTLPHDPQQWVRERPMVGEAVVCSAQMREVYAIVDRLAGSTIPVLILGETGTGKELVAQAIHGRGKRGRGPLRSINCAAIPDQLIESALFGHEKGAFTGATQRAAGVFEEASGGTVFLDEVGELSSSAQAALLRVLESKHICRVGSSKEIEVDVRVVAATHCDLEGMCEAGTFRWDLLYRLNAMTLRVPPLRERLEEIEPLARLFLEQARAETESPARDISDEAMALLRAHAWPGNVRELRNEIARALVVTTGPQIAPEDLSERIGAPSRGADEAHQPEDGEDACAEGGSEDFRSLVQRYEIDLLRAALERTGWNQSAVSRELGIPMRTLTNKIKAYRLRR